jgi:hypothetical protein
MGLRDLARGFTRGVTGDDGQPKPNPASCPRCARLFADSSLIKVHEEQMPSGQMRCFPEERISAELRLVDGVYTIPGSDAARR